MTATLLRGGYLYTADPSHTLFPDGSVLWEHGQILAVGDTDAIEAHPAASGAEVINARGFVILPGFVNAHWHDLFAMRIPFKGALRPPTDREDQAAFMALGGDLNQISTAFDSFRSLAAAMTPEEAQDIAAYSLWTQLRAGTTTLGDVGSLNRPAALIEAARTLGMRLSVSTWAADIVCRPGSTAPERTNDTDEVLAEIGTLIEQTNTDSHIKVRPSAVYGVNMSDELGRGLGDLARTHQLGFATHVGALRNEREASLAYFGHTPIARLERLGLVQPGLMAVHTAFADHAETEALIRVGAHVSFSPAKYGPTGESALSETRAMQTLRQRGLPVSLSTDGGPLPLGGMVEAMKCAWLGLNEMSADPTELLPTDALAMATLIPAHGLGWSESIGSLEPGKNADLVMIDRTDWRYLLNPRPLEGLLGLGSSADVDTVIVNGQVLVRGGKPTRHDESTLRERYLQSLTTFSQRCLNIPPSTLAQLRKPISQGGLR